MTSSGKASKFLAYSWELPEEGSWPRHQEDKAEARVLVELSEANWH